MASAPFRWEGMLAAGSNPEPDRDHKLTERDQARLGHILARLASPFEGERAAAGLLATAFMAKHGLTWSDVTIVQWAGPPQNPETPFRDRRHGTGRPWRGYCRRHPPRPGHSVSCLA